MLCLPDFEEKDCSTNRFAKYSSENPGKGSCRCRRMLQAENRAGSEEGYKASNEDEDEDAFKSEFEDESEISW